jgi:rRNA processing protein Gar1
MSAAEAKRMADEDQVSWRGVTYGTPVLASDGTRVGTVHEVLGSDSEDIFHGIRLKMDGHDDVVIPAENISGLTTSAVTSDLSLSEIQGLPAYADEATYHLASVGWLRKHLGWKQDSKSDEEPG